MSRRDVLDRLISTSNPLRTAWLEQLVEAGTKEGYSFTIEEIAARIDEPGRDESAGFERVTRLLLWANGLQILFWLLYWLHQWIGFWDFDIDLEGWISPVNAVAFAAVLYLIVRTVGHSWKVWRLAKSDHAGVASGTLSDSPSPRLPPTRSANVSSK